MPIYETSKIFQEEIELSEDTVNSSIFIRDRYDYWPEDVVKAYSAGKNIIYLNQINC